MIMTNVLKKKNNADEVLKNEQRQTLSSRDFHSKNCSSENSDSDQDISFGSQVNFECLYCQNDKILIQQYLNNKAF